MVCVLCKVLDVEVDLDGLCQGCVDWIDLWEAKFAAAGIGGDLRAFMLDVVANPKSAAEVASISEQLARTAR
jgi:hypothetical protein